ncbi:hypothetical protein H4R21_003268 [Coemansia helicoidea]|uniref:Uncharacterized protein n=1 Tax=Coemansia helicoidea TaxID=1286919 RepID=A0ACC1L3G6_9FUNG|nr:hypothetical protein H4R21_003268 [Coemansia helicoidea]
MAAAATAGGPGGRIRAVIFDIGGVVVESPFLAIAAYEREQGLPDNYLNVALTKRGAAGAFQQYERGEIGHGEFVRQWARELNEVEANNEAYRGYLRRRGLDGRIELPRETRVDGAALFARMMAATQTPNDCVVELIRWLRRCGYRVAALTNNFKDGAQASGLGDLLASLFDEVVESAVVGLRKPDPRFYLLACERLGIRPSEAVFLDDIGSNLRAAARLGMATVRVEIGKEPAAVAAVKRLVAARGAHAANL